MVISCLTGLTFTTSASATYTAVLDGATPYATVKDALDTITDTANHEITLIADTDEEIVIPEKRDITLDLNNHVLSGKESAEGPIIFVNIVMCKLTIKDGSDNKTPKYFNVDEQTGVWTLAEDQSTPTEYSVLGGCITGAKRYSESECNKGGAIFNSGTLVVKDIAIVGNEANMGAAIYNEAWTGNLTLDGAVIAGNYADIGAGIDSRHDATIKNTTIAENKAVECAGLFANGSTTIGDGTIIKNNTTTDSYPSAGAYLYHTNEWDATMMLTGDVVIKDNKSAGNDANLCLQNEVVTLDSLSSTSQIGVSVLDDNEALTSGKFASGTKGDAMRLTPDNSSYSISRDSSTNDISLLLSLGTCGAEGNESNVTWDFDYTTGTLTISGTGAMVDFAYGDNTSAFRPLKDLVKKVVIADGVTSIGNSAFENFAKLEEVSIGAGVKTIREFAFRKSGLKSVTIPKNVEFINSQAFARGANLTTINIENDDIIVDGSICLDNAHYKDTNNWYGNLYYVGNILCDVSNPSTPSVVTLKPETTGVFWNEINCRFSDTSNITGYAIAETNTKFKTVDGVLFTKDGKELLTCPAGKTGEFTIPDGTEKIAISAFDSTKLSKVTIPASVKEIGRTTFNFSKLTELVVSANIEVLPKSFAGASNNLKTIVLPGTIKEIEKNAFSGCTALENIFVPDDTFDFSKLTIADNNAPFTKDKIKPLHGTCGTYGKEADVVWDFDYTTGTLTISGTGGMGEYDTSERPSYEPLKDLVKKVVIADGVASIGEFAFYGYTNLTELSIGKNVLNIYGSAFENTGLTSLYVPKNVVSISEKAFYNATKLNSITFENENLACGSSNQFMGTAYAKNNANWSDGIMYVGTSAVQFDKTRVDGNVITFKPDTTATFLEKGYIEEISVQGFEIAETNQKYKTVNGVLYSKDGKTLIRFPGSVTGEFVIPEGVNNIGQTAFERTKLSKVTTPSTTKKIHSFVFEKSTSLTDVIIKGDVEEIEIMLFYECTALKNISLPATVKNVLMGAFYDCNALENIYFDGSMALAQKIKISTMMNTPFTLDKFKVLFDDKLDGVVNMSNYKTWTHYPYTLKGWYDEKGSLLVGDASYFQSYTAKWLNEYGNEVVDKAIDFFDLPTTDMMDTQGWKWDSATKTLTLNNATFDCSGIYKKESTPAIELPDGATVVSETDSVNTIIGPVSDAQSVGIWATGEVTFVGDGTINVKTSNEKKANTALLAFGNVTVKDEMKLVLCKGKDVGVFKAISLDLRGESTELTLNDKATITAYNRITCEYEYGLGNYFITGEKDGERTRTYGRDSIKDFYEECIVIYRAGTLSETGLYKYGGGGGGATRPATVKKDEEQKVEETDTEETIVGAKKLELIIGSKVIDVDGKTVENDVAPLIRNDRTMLPARFVAENLGATVEWDEEQQKVTITSADKKTVITLVIGLPVIFVTDTTAKEGATKELELECAPFIENDRTYTPLRAIAEALGAKVEWEEATQKVTISR